MAEIVKTVKIETGNGERTVKSLRKEISDLRDALLNMDKGGEEWKKTATELTKAQEDLNSVMKAGKEVIDADSSSIAGMEARYKALYQTYRLLSQEQRKTAEGMSMQKELAELSKNLNTVKKDAGNFKDNIGHYAEDMMSAFSSLGISIGGLATPFKLATGGANGFKAALNVLAKHPIMTVIVVLVGLLKKVGDAIKGNEELQMRWNKVMAAFKPIGDAVALILDKVAGLAVKVAEGIAKVVTWVTNLLGVTKKLSDAELALADAENNLIKTRREINELNSNDEARIQELLEEASLTDDKIEKEKLLTEAKELQEQVNKRNIELAEEELRIIKEKNAITPSSTEDLDKESAAQVKVNQERANGERALRRINNQIKANQKAAESAGQSERNELDKILERLKKNTQTELEELKEKYEEELKLLKKYHKDTTALTEEYNKNVEKINTQMYVNMQKAGIEAYGALYNAFLKPSGKAFNYLELTALDTLDKLQTELKKEFNEVNAGTTDSLLYNIVIGKDGESNLKKFIQNGELTSFAEKLNGIFGANINVEDKLNIIALKLQAVYAGANLAWKESLRGYVEWKSELDDLENERNLERTKNTNLTYGGLATAEQEYYKNRVEIAKKAWDEIKNLGEIELNEKGFTLNEKLERETAYYAALNELRDHDIQAQLAARQAEAEIEEERIEALHNLKMESFDSITSIADTYKVLLEAYKKDGRISEQEAKKKAKTLQWLEGIQGAVAVASIVADTASAWMSVNKSLAAEYVLNAETAAATGPAAAATKAALDAKSLVVANIRKASLIVNGVTAAAAAVGKTIANIKSLGGDSEDGGGAGATAAPQLIDSTPYSYTRQLQTDVEREEMLNTPIYVRVTDIESVQARVKVTEAESTF